MSPIRFAVVGLGFVGKRHAALIERHPEAQLVALCDIRPAADLDLPYPNVPFFQNIDALLQAGIELDVVCVCTPNGLHCSHTVKALQAGKHVVCEKPMALSKQECERMIFQSLHSNRHVFCVMQNRYSPPSQWVKQVVSEGLLGDIFMAQINCYWNRDDRYYFPNGRKDPWKGTIELDGGTLFTQFSHFVDILYWLFGDIKNVQARFSNFNHGHSIDFEDSGMVSFNLPNGGFGCLNYSTATFEQNLESSLTIIGSNGSIKIGGQYMNEVLYCHIEGYTMPQLAPTNPANDYGHYKGSAANHTYVIQNVIDALQGRCPISTNALEGMKVVEIIERIYKHRK